MRRVYFIEIDLDEEQDIKDILKELDNKVQVRPLNFKSFDEYDTFRHYQDVLGA